MTLTEEQQNNILRSEQNFIKILENRLQFLRNNPL